MHYWSLSIEEQFYIFWPLILLAIGTLLTAAWRRRAVVLFLAFLCLASFAACLWVVQRNQPLAFFHTGARVWELGIGALLAVLAPKLGQFVGVGRGALAWLGAAMVLVPSLALTETIVHPGPITLIPVAGCGLLVAAGVGTRDGGTLIGRLLSSAPMVWIGDRSYSFYLWHWPIIILAKTRTDRTWLIGIVAVVGTLVLGELAYRYVESPIRHGAGAKSSRMRQLGGALAVMAGVCVLALGFPAATGRLASAEKERWAAWVKAAINDDGGVPYRVKCHRGDEADQPECAFAKIASEKAVVLFGDSHAAHWFPAFEKAALAEGWRLHSWSKSACPSADVKLWNPHKKAPYATCHEWRASLFERLKAAPRPMLVVLSNSNGYSGWMLAPDGTTVVNGRAADEEFERGLRRSVEALQAMGHRVAIVKDTPLADPKYRDCVQEFGPDLKCARKRERALNSFDPEGRVAARFPSVILIDATDVICTGDICPVVKDGAVIYRDDSHLTTRYSASLWPLVSSVLSRTVLSAQRK